MTTVNVALRAVTADLTSLDARFALVGGLAVSARVEPRFTRDVDLAVAVESDSDAEGIVRGLLNRGYRVIALVEHLDAGRLGTARLSAPVAPDVIVDLLFASCGIELEIVAAAEMVQATAGLSLPVASIGHLVAMKLLARDGMRRPQDLFDLVTLRPVLSAEDVADAAAAADLITERGFARDRDLRQLLEDYLAQPPPELPAGFRLR